MQVNQAINLPLPPQDLADTRFAPAEPSAVQQWLDQRHRANVGQFTRDLHQALTELNHCRLEPSARLAVLEVLRPAVHAACQSLDRHLHSQPMVLPAQTDQTYQLAQTLENQLATGYRIVASESPPQRKRFLRASKSSATDCATAIHRAITEKTHILLRACRLYLDVNPGFWHEIHQLFHYAAALQLQDRPTSDAEAALPCPLSLQQLYLKALLVGCIHSQGLRPEELQAVAEQLNEWLPLVALAPYRVADDDCIAINLLGDMPPVYHALFHPPANTGDCRLLVVDDLLARLRELLATPAQRPSQLSDDLIKHLLLSWGAYGRRAHRRIKSSNHLALCLGMTNLHYFACGETEFGHWLEGNRPPVAITGEEQNPFLCTTAHRSESDIWDDVMRPHVSTMTLSLEPINAEIRRYSDHQPSTGTDNSSHTNHQLQMVNASSGGYCLQWPAEITATLKTGEIVGVRETTHHASWGAGIVRWIHRNNDTITRLGLELLSPRIIPFGARITNRADTSGESYRVLLLPELESAGQTTTLVTPALPFREKQKLELLQPGHVMTVQLMRQVATTGSISRFEYEIIRDSVALADDTAQDFEELWQSL